jgi:hypothetical protein
MPKTLTWGRSIDVLELTSTTTRAIGRPRVWEVHTKRGGGLLGMVTWRGPSRAYVFETTKPHMFDSGTLIDIGKFCRNQTEAMMQEKRKAAG